MDAASILDLLRTAVHERQIMVSLHAAEEALAEGITRPEIEAAILSRPQSHSAFRLVFAEFPAGDSLASSKTVYHRNLKHFTLIGHRFVHDS